MCHVLYVNKINMTKSGFSHSRLCHYTKLTHFGWTAVLSLHVLPYQTTPPPPTRNIFIERAILYVIMYNKHINTDMEMIIILF